MDLSKPVILPEETQFTMYRCEICQREFETHGALGGHIKSHDPKNAEWLRQMVKQREAWRDLIDLTPVQKQLILGSLMGDMSLTYQRNRKNSHTKRPKLVISHCSEQHEYVMWKYSILKDISTTEPKISKNTGSFREGAMISRFSCKTLGCMIPIYDLTHPPGSRVKMINQSWLDSITDPIAIAAWYMDDGNVSRHGKYQYISLHTEAMGEDGTEMIAYWMLDKWDIDATTKKDKRSRPWGEREYNYVAISNQEDVQRFLNLVKPYVLQVKSMHYKLPASYMI
jgi:hypothetical protein